MEKKFTAESGNVLKHDDSSTVRDEQSLYNQGLVNPKILSSHNLPQSMSNPDTNIQIITN